MKSNIVIFEKEEQTKEVILGYLSDNENVQVDKVFSDYQDGIKYIRENTPKMVLFSMDSDKSTCLKMIKRISDFGINVIALSEDYTTSNIIQVLRSGARDFVSKPVIKKDLDIAIIKCSQDEVKTIKKSQIITVYSNKGGVGKTAIATNLGIELARLTREKVALVDLNLPMGDITTFLDLIPTIDISDIVNGAKDDVKSFMLDACRQYKNSGMFVLAEPPSMEQNRSLSTAQIVKLFDMLRETFSYVVVDMGTTVDKLNMSILENSDIVLLVTIVNLPLIRNCQRCIDLFEHLNFPQSKVKVLVNRYLENDEITIEDVEKTLKKTVFWKVPNNYYTMMSSINKGIPVSEINEKSNITESFSGLAAKLTDEIFETNFE